jgi:hypothetical protein
MSDLRVYVLIVVSLFICPQPPELEDNGRHDDHNQRYMKRVDHWMGLAIENAELGGRYEEAAKIKAARERFRRHLTIDGPLPYVLWFDLVPGNKDDESTDIGVYWVDKSWHASGVRIKLVSGGEIWCKIDPRYIEDNKDLYKAGEGMWALAALGDDNLRVALRSEDIAEVVIEHR